MRAAGAVALLLLASVGCGSDRPAAVRVFAAASFVDVMEELASDFEGSGGEAIEIHAASSSLLARQIAAGAPADLYVGASTEWGRHVAAERGEMGTPLFVLATNRLVVVAPTTSTRTLSALDQVPAGPEIRWVLADPRHVPAGVYARSALEAAGAFERVSAGMVAAADARTALTYVARGDVNLGIVYATDAAAEPRVRVLLEIPSGTHAPIEYPVVVLRDSHAGAAAFAAYLRSDAARDILAAHGFGSP